MPLYKKRGIIVINVTKISEVKILENLFSNLLIVINSCWKWTQIVSNIIIYKYNKSFGCLKKLKFEKLIIDKTTIKIKEINIVKTKLELTINFL